jgi:nucleoside-diphosphate-sugar epimerase
MAEEALAEYRDRLPVLIIRPPAVYGPRDKDFFLFFNYIKHGIFPYWGKCRYSLIYVDDLVRGILLAAFSPESAGKTYFISDEHVYTNDEIALAMSEALSRKKPLKLTLPKFLMPAIILVSNLGRMAGTSGGAGILNSDKLKELRHNNWVCDPGRARRELGFSTKISLKEGIKWTADWYRIHQWL